VVKSPCYLGKSPSEIATGFDDAGASAAEVKTPSEIYPKAFFGAKNDDS
jgi:hypothetical protein